MSCSIFRNSVLKSKLLKLYSTSADSQMASVSSTFKHLQAPRACYTESDLIATDASKPLWKHQASLPMLPVPTLQETAQRYLQSVRPLLSDKDYAKTQNAVADFIKPNGVGEVLQKRLLERKDATDKEHKSWLIDWWNDYAYMGYRDPIVINVSYFFVFKDVLGITDPVRRGAQLLQGAAAYKELIVSGKMEPEMNRTSALDMHMFRFLFNNCRIPAKPSDVTRSVDPSKFDHVIVVRKNKFYKFNLCVDGQPLSTREIELQLAKIVKMAGTTKDPAVGALTGANRDKWTTWRDHLIESSSTNAASLNEIETASMVLCMDDTSPVTKEEASRACWHGDGQNRFYDKPLEFIVFENGKAGFLGEHSMMDATPTSSLCDFVCSRLDTNKIEHYEDRQVRSIADPVKLAFVLDAQLKSSIDETLRDFNAVVDKHEVTICAMEAYGKNFIKKLAVSPDAYAQMAIQLAYYKMYGRVCPTYESATTRKFAYGRTETCRSCSSDSAVWVKAMADAQLDDFAKGELGRKAVASQGKYMADCIAGKGVDRHLLGLRLLLKPNEQKPELYEDKAYSMSGHWNLSTSQISSEYYDGYGWGEVVPDGYGIAYMVKNDCLSFNIACVKGMHSARIRHYLEESLREMKVVFEKTIPPKSKL